MGANMPGALLITLQASLFALLYSCSLTGSGDITAAKSETFNFTSRPKGWVKYQTDRAQHAFTNQSGSVVYADSYCGYFKKNLRELSLDHIKSLGDVEISSREEMPYDGGAGIFSKVYSKYSGKALLIYHFGYKDEECYYDINGVTSATDEIEADFMKFIEAAKI